MKARGFRIVSILTMLTLAVGASLSIAFASWQFNQSVSPTENALAGVTDNWTFASPVDEGSTIVVHPDGTIEIDGEPVTDADVTYPPGQTPNAEGGTIEYTIGVIDGELVITDYTATDVNGNGGLFSTTNSVISFPSYVEVGGVQYPIHGITQPIEIDLERHVHLIYSDNCTINVPDGYRTICDNAFQGVTTSGNGSNTNVTLNLPTSLEYLGYHAINNNATGIALTINYAGTKAQFKALVDASAAEYGSGYVFFTATGSNRCTVRCSDGNVVYNQNGTVYSG